MRLSQLLQDIISIPTSLDFEVNRLTLDSRKIVAGDVFLAIKGSSLDGRQYIPEAIKKGVKAILVDSDSADTLKIEQNIPLIPVANLQQELGFLAARFYDYPAKKLQMIGVTGTSGKTSCTQFIAQCLTALDQSCGVIGTLGSGLYGELVETGLTTPDALSLQATLTEFVEKGAKATAMEVSSHSIDQGRINGINFAVGIFTNLSQDHLDYHGDMQTYANVKRRFFAEFPVKNAVLNLDDPVGQQWFSELASTKSILTFSTQSLADVYCEKVQLTMAGITAEIRTPWGKAELNLPLVGRFNLSNALAALCALCLSGIAFEEAVQQLSQLKAVPGRMQALGGQGKPLVIVDYAHKPDALEKVLQVLRAHVQGKLVCVFGCGGERDRGKRPLMAKIAENLADTVIITNDNPRNEQPEAIAKEILQGFSHPERVFIELDRSKAIQKSIQYASPSDCILLAGKGAERYQQIGDQKFPFDDVEKVKEYLF